MDGVDAGKLIAFACDLTATPGASGESAEYRRLVERYLAEAVFRMLVDDIAEGVGCEVVHVSPREGLVLRSQPDGPWAWPAHASDLPWNKRFSASSSTSAFDRAARMLVIPALLAFIAPSAADYDDLLSDPTLLPSPVTVRELENFIREFAAHRERDHPDPTGEERSLWWHWLQAASETPTVARIGRSASSYPVFDVLQYLSQLGLLIKLSGSAEDTAYRPRRRLLHHYRDLLINDLFANLREFAVSEPNATSNPVDGGA